MRAFWDEIKVYQLIHEESLQEYQQLKRGQLIELSEVFKTLGEMKAKTEQIQNYDETQ